MADVTLVPVGENEVRLIPVDESNSSVRLFGNDRSRSGGMQSVLGIASPSDRAARAVADDIANVITTAPATVVSGAVRGAGSLQVAVAQAKAPGFMPGMGYVDGTGKAIPVDDTGEIFTPPDRSYYTKRDTGMERSGFDKMDQADATMAQIKQDAPVSSPLIDKYLREGFNQAGNMLPTLPLAAIPVIGPELSVQLMAQGAGADAIKKGRELGLTDEEIDDYKSKTVTPEYVGERLSIAPMLAMLNNKVPFFKALGTSTLAEVGSELGTSHFQLAADKAYETPGLSKEERNRIYDSWINMDAQRKDPKAMTEWVENMKDTAITTLGMTHVMGAAGGAHRVASKIGEAATAPSRGMNISAAEEANAAEPVQAQQAPATSKPVTLSPYQNEAYDDTTDMPAPKGPLETATSQSIPTTTTGPETVPDNIPAFTPPTTPVTTESVPPVDVSGGMAPPSEPVTVTPPPSMPGYAIPARQEVTEADQVDFENAVLWENNLRKQGRTAVPDIEGEPTRDHAWRLLETYRKMITPTVAADSAAQTVQSDSEQVKTKKGKVNGATDTVPSLQSSTPVDGVALPVPAVQGKDDGSGSNLSQPGGIANGNLSQMRQETSPAQEVSPVRGADVVTPIDEAAHVAATSPHNDTPEPTQAQIEAGNYKKGHINLHGLNISIENPSGSLRKGVDETGKAWETGLQHHYGYIKGTVGKDKDHIDVFIKPGIDQANAGNKVFVVDQLNGSTGKFDEHKVLMGFDNLKEATAAYLSNYDEQGPQRIGMIDQTSVDSFQKWLGSDTTKPFSGGRLETAQEQQEHIERLLKLKAAAKTQGEQNSVVNSYVSYLAKRPWLKPAVSIASVQSAIPDKNVKKSLAKMVDEHYHDKTGKFIGPENVAASKAALENIKAFAEENNLPVPPMVLGSISEADRILAERSGKAATFAQTRLRALERKLKKAQGPVMIKKAQKALDDHKATMKASEPDTIKIKTIRAAKPVEGLNPSRDHLLTAIAKLGGLDLANAVSLWGSMAGDAATDKKINHKLFGRPLFRKIGGLNVDTMAELLAEHGYLQRDENHKHDLVDFEERLTSAIAGKTVVSDQNHQEIALEMPDFSDEDLNELSLDDSVAEFITDEYADLFEELSEEDYNTIIAHHEAINREAVRLIKEIENADSESATAVRQDKQVSASEEATVPERDGPAVIEGDKPSETPETGKRPGAASSVESQDKLFATPPTFGTKPQPKTTNSDVSTSDLLDNFTSVESVQPDLLKVMPKEQTFNPIVMPSLDDFDKLVTELTAKPEETKPKIKNNDSDSSQAVNKRSDDSSEVKALVALQKPGATLFKPAKIDNYYVFTKDPADADNESHRLTATRIKRLEADGTIINVGVNRYALNPDKATGQESKLQSAKIHASNAYDAGLDAIKAILDNASNPDKLNSGIGIDDEVYQQIKPHLTKMWFEAKAAGSDAMQALREFIQRVINDLGENIVPYSRTFYQEVLNGDIIEATNKGEETDVNVERSSADLERDSQDSGTADRVGQEALSDGPDGTDGSIRPGSDATADSKFVTGRDPVLPRREAATPGEFGNPPVQSNQQQAESAERTAGSEFDQRSGDFDVARTSPEPVAAAAVDKAATRVHELKARLEAQKSAQRVKVVPGDLGNIEQTLPLLLTGQTDDVKFAEDRFALPTGYGAMFTNGTGTGKTFSGLGIIKRLERQGKKNVLIVTPQANVLNAWVKSGKHFLLDITPLKDTQDAGTGIVVTTYANFGQNNALVQRQWDAVVFDEAHYLNSNQTGDATNAQTVMRAITLHPDGAWQRADMLNGELKAKTAEASAAFNEAYKKKAPQAELDQLKAPLDALNRKMDEARKQVQAEVMAAQGTDKRSRVLFLSATPFAYDKNIEYANGYLFDYGPPVNSGGYNSGGAKERFFMQHFGYRMRYNKLTEPEAEVDQGLMQRQFNSWLKQNKALSGRMLAVDQDYDRKFVLLDSAIGRTIDEGLQFLQDDHAQYGPLYSYIGKKFDYLHRRYLLEAIKAKEIIPIIKQHLALGRKVVVFHDYNQGGGMNPFDVRGITGSKELVTVGTYPHQSSVELGSIATRFVSERPDLVKLPFASYGSALSTLHDAFPAALLVNGTVSKKDNLKAEELFQDHKSGRNLIIVQADKGKEGISLHDTVGDMPRVLFNLGLPVKPTQAIQQEGRIFRTGQASNAMFRYLNTGTNWERWAFATTIARRASTAENLAMGEDARMLLDAFVEAYQDSDVYAPGHDGEGTGGIARDRAANAALTEWDRALTYYFSQQKKTSRNKAQEGIDYFPTPEPLALKMVEWADIMPGESALEPSAGHGAIARFLPSNAKRRAIEPSTELTSRLGLIFDGDIVQGRFEDHHVVNKYDAIVMNPPFGSASKTAFEHIEKAAQHLKDKGRIVALVPAGPASDKRLEKMLYEEKIVPVEPVGQRFGKDVYTGDTVTINNPNGYGKLTGKITRGVPNGSQPTFWVDFGRGQTAIQAHHILELEPTGKREKKSMSDLTLVADIQLPRVTFERAGTSVVGHIIVLDKNRTDDGSSTRRRDYTAAETINDLFERVRDAELPERQRNSQPYEAAPVTPDAVDTATGTVAADLAQNSDLLELSEFPHTQTGVTMYVAAMKDRLPAEQYAALNKLAKQNGGSYSKYKGGAAVPGFLFKNREARQSFVNAVAGESATSDTTLHSNPMLNPALIVSSLSGLAKNLKEDIPKLVNLGQMVIRDGASTYQQFLADMKQYLGDKWDAFKGVMLKVYHQAKAEYKNSPLGNEIGAIGDIQPIYSKVTAQIGDSYISVRDNRLRVAGFDVETYTMAHTADPHLMAVISQISKDGKPVMLVSRIIAGKVVYLDNVKSLLSDSERSGVLRPLYQAEADIAQRYGLTIRADISNDEVTGKLFKEFYPQFTVDVNNPMKHEARHESTGQASVIGSGTAAKLHGSKFFNRQEELNYFQTNPADQRRSSRVVDEGQSGSVTGNDTPAKHSIPNTTIMQGDSGLGDVTVTPAKSLPFIKRALDQENADQVLVKGGNVDALKRVAAGLGKTIVFFRERGQDAGNGLLSTGNSDKVRDNQRQNDNKNNSSKENTGSDAANGFVNPAQPNIIFLNVDSSSHLLYITGHELSHTIKMQDPALWNQMAKELQPLVQRWSQFKESMPDRYDSLSEEDKAEELFSDVMGHHFLNDMFWQDLAKENAGLFTKIARKAVQLINKVLHLMAGSDVRTYISDLEQSRAIIAKTLLQYGENVNKEQYGKFAEQQDLEYLNSRLQGQSILEHLRSVGISDEKLRAALGIEQSKLAAAWHGSPHDHNGFSTAHIGTGEGNQAYGYGMYFAGNKEVAEHYKKMLTQNQRSFDPELVDVKAGLKDALYEVGNLGFDSFGEVLQTLRKYPETWTDMYEVTEDEAAEINHYLKAYERRIKETQGKLYQVELAPEESDYLLWDKPLSEQSDKVKAALEGGNLNKLLELSDGTWKIERVGDDDHVTLFRDGVAWETFNDKQEARDYLAEKIGGEGIYRDLAFKYKSQQAASEYLHSLGIRGIKYLDGSSRSQGEGNYNYVIFNDADVSITNKYSIKRNLENVSEKSLLDNLKGIINPLDYSRFRTSASERLPHHATTWLADNVGNPFWMKENNPDAVPFYEEAKDREVTRMDNNVRMFGGLFDKEGKRVGWDKVKGLFDWSDKTTGWGKVRQEMYNNLTDKQKAAYDVIRFEGDAYNKTYAKLADALRNVRIKAAGMDAQTFTFYQTALAEEAKAFDVKLAIAQENMAEAGMTPEDIEGHIAEYRAKYKDIEGWVHRDHGEGEYQVRVYQTVDSLDFESDVVQHKDEPTDRIRLGTFPGVELSRSMEKLVERRGGSFKQLRNGAIIILMPEGRGQDVLDEFHELPLVDKDGEPKYKVLVYNRFVSSIAEAKKLTAKVKSDYQAAMPRNYRDGYTYDTSWNFSAKVNEEDYQVLKTSDMKLELILRNAIDKAKAKSEISAVDAAGVQDALVQSVAEILLGRGAGLYQIRRAQYLIEGYDTDNAVKKYEDYINGTAGLFSKARYALRQFNNMKSASPQIRAWATKYVGDSLRNMGTADKISGNMRAIVSLWYLGFNTSWMLVNSTQPYVLGQAELSRYTTSPALKIAKAEKDILTGKLSAEEKALLEDMQVRSQDHDSVMAEMTGSLEGVTGKASQVLHNVTQAAMALGQKVEVLNRHTMIVAGYRVFKDQGMDHAAALKKALDVNSMVNIDMGRFNLPGWARGPIGRTFYALQSYIQHMLNYLWNRSSSGNRNDQKAVLRLLFAMFLIGGLPAGAPGSDELDKLIQKMFGYSPKLALKAWSSKMAKDYGTVGEMLEAFVWHGVPGALKPFGVGVSLTGATQLRIPVISNVIAGDDMAKSLGGPVWGLAQKGKMSIQAALRGDWGRSAEYLLPTSIANPLSGIRQATDGVKTASGKRVDYKGKQLKMEPQEAAIRAFGLQPVRTADISETRGYEKSTQAEWNDRRKDALDNYRMSRKLKFIQEFNKDLRGSQAQGLVPAISTESLANVWGKTNKKKNSWEREHGAD